MRAFTVSPSAVVMGFLAVLGTAQEPTRTATEILREFDRIRTPQHSGGASPEDVARFRLQVKTAAKRSALLALELYELQPDHPRVPEVMGRRWAAFNNTLGYTDLVLRETDALLADPKADERLLAEAHLARARVSILDEDMKDERRQEFLRLALEALPTDERVGAQLVDYARRFVIDLEARRRWAERGLRFPEGSRTHKLSRAIVNQLDRMGEQLSLRFEDVLTKRTIDVSDLRGKPVLIHVYALTSAKPEETMGRWKALREELGERVHFLGVHQYRVEGGEPVFARWLEEHGVDWPQHYEGERLHDEWSWNQRIFHTPTFLVLDEEGRLAGWSWTEEGWRAHAARVLEGG